MGGGGWYATFIPISTALRKITEKMSFPATYLQCLVLGLVIIANSQVLFNILYLTRVSKSIVKLDSLSKNIDTISIQKV